MSTEKSLIKNSAFNMAYSVLNLVFPLITTIYVSRIILPEGVGQVAYAQNITSYFITFACMGLPTYGIREVAKTIGRQEERNKLFTELFLLNFMSTLVATIAFLVLICQSAFDNDRNVMFCCGIQLLLNFINIDWLYQGLEEYVYIVCRNILVKIFSLIAIFTFVRSKEDYIWYALITSIALAGNYFFNVFNARKYVKFQFYGLSFKRHLNPIFILGVSLFFSTIYSKLDITMIGAMYSNTETGLYSNAFRLTNIISSICASISAVFLPRLSYCYQSEKEQFYKLIDFGIQVLSFFCFPMTIGLVVLSPQVVDIAYGEAFQDAAITIRILSLLVLIKSFGDLLCYQLSIATGNEKKRLLAYILAACMNVAVNFLLIPHWGRNGAAVASVLSELILNTMLFVQMKRIVKYSLRVKILIQGLLSAILMAIVMVIFINLFENMLIQCMVGFFTGAITYLVANFVLGNEIMFKCLMKLKLDTCLRNDYE